jgi:hypothetical protein
VDGGGHGGSVEVNLSQFASNTGAYGMFTLRVVAGDPAEPSTPKPFGALAASAIGTGRAYVWRGPYLVELQYVNEQESPDQLSAASDAILRAVGKEIGGKLPGPPVLLPVAAALPEANRLPNGIVFQPKDVFGWVGVGPVAVGYYKEGERRWRTLSIVKDDIEQAKDIWKTMTAKPGTLPIAALGDQAAHVVVPGVAGAPKIELLIARKGASIVGIADEEYALNGPDKEKARLTKDEALARIKPLLGTPDGGAAAKPVAPSSSKK